MNLELPKYHETFIPVLDILSNGKKIHVNELKKAVRDKHYSHLDKQLLNQRIKSGEITILHRIGWAKSYLKHAGFVTQPERGMVKITEKGMARLKTGELTLQQLQMEPEYIERERKKRQSTKHKEETQEFENATPHDLIDQGIETIERIAKGELLDKFKSMDPYYFEKVILILLRKMGYGEFKETPKSGDGGIDGIINQDQLGLEKIYIQAKRFAENKVREKDIRNFIEDS